MAVTDRMGESGVKVEEGLMGWKLRDVASRMWRRRSAVVAARRGFFVLSLPRDLRETWRRLEALGRGTCVGILGAVGEHGRGQTVHS